jgi:hypothetical protein
VPRRGAAHHSPPTVCTKSYIRTQETHSLNLSHKARPVKPLIEQWLMEGCDLATALQVRAAEPDQVPSSLDGTENASPLLCSNPPWDPRDPQRASDAAASYMATPRSRKQSQKAVGFMNARIEDSPIRCPDS